MATRNEIKIATQYQNDDEKNENHPHSKLSLTELKQIKIIQKNQVYVVGISSKHCSYNTLSSIEWFGRFGSIKNIIIGNSFDSIQTDSRYIHVIYENHLSAKKAINWINNELLCDDGRILKAMYGFTFYCQFWRMNKCQNTNCHYLHRWCKQNEILTPEILKRFQQKVSGAMTTYHSTGDIHPNHTNYQSFDKQLNTTSNPMSNTMSNVSGMAVIPNHQCLQQPQQSQQSVNQQLNMALNPMSNGQSLNQPLAAIPNHQFFQQSQQSMAPIPAVLYVPNMTQNPQQIILQQKQEIMALTQRLQAVSQSYNNLTVKYENLEMKYCALDSKYMELEKHKLQNHKMNGKKNYLIWNVRDVYEWMISVNNGYFFKYSQILYKNLRLENITGSCLDKINNNDLHRIGVTDFKDKIKLIAAIRKLMSDHINNTDEGN